MSRELTTTNETKTIVVDGLPVHFTSTKLSLERLELNEEAMVAAVAIAQSNAAQEQSKAVQVSARAEETKAVQVQTSKRYYVGAGVVTVGIAATCAFPSSAQYIAIIVGLVLGSAHVVDALPAIIRAAREK